MSSPLKRGKVNPICSAMLAVLAFVALMLPIIIPGLEPGLLGAHPSHGHLTVDGVILPHSHDLNSLDVSEIIFTGDDSGSAGAKLVMLWPSLEQVTPSFPLFVEQTSDAGSTGQWSPRSIPAPPRLSA